MPFAAGTAVSSRRSIGNNAGESLKIDQPQANKLWCDMIRNMDVASASFYQR